MTLTARSAPRLVGGTSSRLDRVFPAWAFRNGRFLANSFQHTITARRCPERHPRARRAFRGKDLPDGELRYVGSIPSAALFGGRSGYLGAWLCFREKARQLEVDLAGVSPCDAVRPPADDCRYTAGLTGESDTSTTVRQPIIPPLQPPEMPQWRYLEQVPGARRGGFAGKRDYCMKSELYLRRRPKPKS